MSLVYTVTPLAHHLERPNIRYKRDSLWNEMNEWSTVLLLSISHLTPLPMKLTSKIASNMRSRVKVVQFYKIGTCIKASHGKIGEVYLVKLFSWVTFIEWPWMYIFFRLGFPVGQEQQQFQFYNFV